MALTIEQLEKGIEYWHLTRWPKDFHNSFYEEMASKNPNGNFTVDWWDDFSKELRKWRATRPVNRQILKSRANDRFCKLKHSWNESIARHIEGDISTVNWDDISFFPETAIEIKGVKSPVFVSKFCHFLAPQIFPVIDNTAMGNKFSTYKQYYQSAQNEWRETKKTVQRKMISILQKEAGSPLFAAYPVKTKLIELCLIGCCFQRRSNQHE